MSFEAAVSPSDEAGQMHGEAPSGGRGKSSTEYRPGIDGLRAIAVLSVFVFHLNNGWLPGGFVGVDVFFVVSGYLITSILLREYEHRSFSLWKFYQRRIARLFPAFFAVALGTVFGAWIIYSPQDLASCGATMMAASLSLANIKFMLLGSYFQVFPDSQPFLHYWSLSVEEQFYLLFPLFFLIVYLKANRHRNLILSIFFGLSYLACIALTRTRPVWAFYLLPTRAWELLAGSILANIAIDRKTEASKWWPWLSLTGLILIGGSFCLIHQGANFPGYIAMVPVLGTVGFLGLNKSSTGFAERLLSWKPMVGIGRVSYSLYLVHWPIICLVDYKLYMGSAITRLGLKLGLTAVLTVGSYFLIERPGRIYLNQPAKRRLAYAFFATLILIFVPLGAFLKASNSSILIATPADIAAGGLIFNPANTRGTIVLMGDSQGAMYGKAIRQIADQLNLKLNVITVIDSDMLPTPAGQNSLWTDSLAVVKHEKPTFVFLVCRWEVKLKGDPGRLATAVNELRKYADNVVLITQPPIQPEGTSREQIRRGSRPPFYEDQAAQAARSETNALVKSLRSDHVIVVDIEHLLKKTDGELIFASSSGQEYYHDALHLSYDGTELVKPDLLKAVSDRIK